MTARAGIVVALVFACGAAAFTLQGLQRPLIIVVQSYAQHLPWTRGTAAGLHRVLDGARDVRVRWLYLDANQPGRDGYAQSKIDNAAALVAAARPQVLVAMDDRAQAGIAAPLLGRQAGWIIFGGIHDAGGALQNAAAHPANPASAGARVAGISQRTPWPAVQALLAEFARQKGVLQPRVALINDTSPAGDEESASFGAQRWQGMRVAGVWRCKDQAAWRAALDALRGRADLVVVGDYRGMPPPDGSDRLRARREVARMTLAALPLPLVALSGYAVNDGIPVGILPSPQEQGEQAALLALAAARGAALPYRQRESREFIIHANPPVLAARQLALPELYLSFAQQVAPLFQAARE